MEERKKKLFAKTLSEYTGYLPNELLQNNLEFQTVYELIFMGSFITGDIF